MRWRPCLLIGWFSVVSLVVGCVEKDDPDTSSNKATVGKGSPPAHRGKEAGDVVFRARYYKGKGPCIRKDDGWAMPAVDDFEVVEVVRGKLNASDITVRLHTNHGPGYPADLKQGEVYTLRLSPSEGTKQQLRQNAKEATSLLEVDGDEISEVKGNKLERRAK
jgi:hypothetical protein